MELGVWWWCNSSVRERPLFEDGVYATNILELLGMVLIAYFMAILWGDTPVAACNRVLDLLMGGTNSGVNWIKLCRGRGEPRSGALMRLLGGLK